jgi:hypothetical protein
MHTSAEASIGLSQGWLRLSKWQVHLRKRSASIGEILA